MLRNAPFGAAVSRRADWVQELACVTKCFDVAVNVQSLEECHICRGNTHIYTCCTRKKQTVHRQWCLQHGSQL